MNIILTDNGKDYLENYVNECMAMRKEILDARKDTCYETTLPTIEDILNDVMYGVGLDCDNDYINSWGITDNYDLPIMLEYNIDFRMEV